MAGAKKKKPNVFRFYNSETGEHYTIRLSKEAYDKLADKPIKKFSRKLKKHVEFKLIKKVK
jgi:ribosomal protein L33